MIIMAVLISPAAAVIVVAVVVAVAAVSLDVVVVVFRFVVMAVVAAVVAGCCSWCGQGCYSCLRLLLLLSPLVVFVADGWACRAKQESVQLGCGFGNNGARTLVPFDRFRCQSTVFEVECRAQVNVFQSSRKWASGLPRWPYSSLVVVMAAAVVSGHGGGTFRPRTTTGRPFLASRISKPFIWIPLLSAWPWHIAAAGWSPSSTRL